ncbi:MAG: hypothetical protein ACI857_002495 [Arenicella sp.]|jgi:hypothetical protein
MISLASCKQDFVHERYLKNDSSDTITVINPDFDTTFTALPGSSVMFYGFEVLDQEQTNEDCKWLGDSLYITNQDDSLCTRSPKIEDNWIFTIGGTEKERIQTCIFVVRDSDFD